MMGPFVLLIFFRAWAFFTAKPEKIIIVPCKEHSRYSRQEYLDLIRKGAFLGQCDETYVIYNAFMPIVTEDVDHSRNQNWANWVKNDFK